MFHDKSKPVAMPGNSPFFTVINYVHWPKNSALERSFKGLCKFVPFSIEQMVFVKPLNQCMENSKEKFGFPVKVNNLVYPYYQKKFLICFATCHRTVVAFSLKKTHQIASNVC